MGTMMKITTIKGIKSLSMDIYAIEIEIIIMNRIDLIISIYSILIFIIISRLDHLFHHTACLSIIYSL